MERLIKLHVNGNDYTFSVGNAIGQVPESETLLDTIRNRLGLTGSKLACGEGACGCCSVLMDGKAVSSCIMLTVECEGKDIVTIEGLQNPVTGELDPLQQAFLDYNAFQCGFCTPGIIIAAKALLLENPNPTRKEIEEALAGNYCRCISHYQAFDAIESIIERSKA